MVMEDKFQSLEEVPVTGMLPSSPNKKSWLWEGDGQNQRPPETFPKQHEGKHRLFSKTVILSNYNIFLSKTPHAFSMNGPLFHPSE